MHYDPFHSDQQGLAQGASQADYASCGVIALEASRRWYTRSSLFSPDAGEACSLAGRAQRPHGGDILHMHIQSLIARLSVMSSRCWFDFNPICMSFCLLEVHFLDYDSCDGIHKDRQLRCLHQT